VATWSVSGFQEFTRCVAFTSDELFLEEVSFAGTTRSFLRDIPCLEEQLLQKKQFFF
jgi:hypothetical protein